MKTGQTILFWVAMIIIAVLLWKMSNNPGPASPVSNGAELQTQIANRNIQSAQITVYPTRTLVIAEKRGATRFQTYISNEDAPKTIEDLEQIGSKVSLQGGAESQNNWQSFLIDGVPFILLLAAFFIMMRRMQTKNRRDGGQQRPIDV
jgi:ATP-dependent Zn protease